MASSTQSHETHHPTFTQYVVVATLLFAITIVEFLLIWGRVGISDDLGASKIPLLITLSAIKFAIVIMFYMHLKFESRLFSLVFLSGLTLAFSVGIALLSIFVGFGGEPREYAQANAIPYVEHEASEGEEDSTSGQPTGAATLDITVNGDALAFSIDAMNARAGQEVTVSFNNISSVNQHNWVLVQDGTKDAVATSGTAAGPDNNWVEPGDTRVVANTSVLAPGSSGEVTFTAPAAGTYQFVCTFPGHNFTMFGNFEVGG